MFDTNIILDILLNRQPFCEMSARVIDLSATKVIERYISASAITDIYYLAYKTIRDKNKVCYLLERLLQIVSVAGVAETEILPALKSGWNDFEDAVQYYTARKIEVSYIVTRNKKDYLSADIVVAEPQEFFNLMKRE